LNVARVCEDWFSSRLMRMTFHVRVSRIGASLVRLVWHSRWNPLDNGASTSSNELEGTYCTYDMVWYS